jgi:hypothetical protein
MKKNKHKKYDNTKKEINISTIIMLLIIGGFLYYFYKNNNNNKPKSILDELPTFKPRISSAEYRPSNLSPGYFGLYDE